ncbi:hypothetical protein FACS189462_5410 [Spirochaetia bacterium]|nr:hypothetical protein FACS189462_5410 [Spirochaetia bacterium]
MKGKNKLDDLNKVYEELEEKRRNTLLRTAKRLLKQQRSNVPVPSPIDEKKKAD